MWASHVNYWRQQTQLGSRMQYCNKILLIYSRFKHPAKVLLSFSWEIKRNANELFDRFRACRGAPTLRAIVSKLDELIEIILNSFIVQCWWYCCWPDLNIYIKLLSKCHGNNFYLFSRMYTFLGRVLRTIHDFAWILIFSSQHTLDHSHLVRHYAVW